MAAHYSILAWKSPWTEEPTAVGYSPWGRKESDTTSTTEHIMKNNLKKNKYMCSFNLKKNKYMSSFNLKKNKYVCVCFTHSIVSDSLGPQGL